MITDHRHVRAATVQEANDAGAPYFALFAGGHLQTFATLEDANEWADWMTVRGFGWTWAVPLSQPTNEQLLAAAGLNEFGTSALWCEDCEEFAGYGTEECPLCAAACAAGIGAPL